ncbi:hypothetical protein Nham_2140 [Nitrobacter hamburgensis X14]|uniref:Uncharacterized protein n=1 Tax=Nitrobacter hamburgensis (strain DSM 10229 / NCIMB 13809 / X14) TaxID=323097 RepID=Q1QLG1_NITHX|nr:hypothetical protein Nham_2140 [Nitrobacter hamburgensis X14]
MSFVTRFKSFLCLETKSGVSNPDPWLFEQFSGGTSAAGIVVTPRTAMECAPVRCGVQAISETIGQLPLIVYQRGANGSKERDHLHQEPGAVAERRGAQEVHDQASEPSAGQAAAVGRALFGGRNADRSLGFTEELSSQGRSR